MTVKIKTIEIPDADGSPVIVPEIPFSEFPPGPREARPDENGKLCWYVEPLPPT